MDAEECHDFPDHTLHRADRCGDLNLRRELVTWSRAGEGHLVPEVAEHRATEAEGGKQDRLQARKIFNIVEKYRMIQQVKNMTHGQDILDVIFTSDQYLVRHVEINFFPTFTDHGVVTCGTTLPTGGWAGIEEKSYLCETGRRYGALDLKKKTLARSKGVAGSPALGWL